MHTIPAGFVTCPRCAMRFPVARAAPDLATLQDYLHSAAQVKCPNCDSTFACGSAISFVEMEPVQDGTTLDPSPVRSLDGFDNH